MNNRLTPSQRKEIKNLWATGDYTKAAIAKKVGVHPHTVTNYTNPISRKKSRASCRRYERNHPEVYAESVLRAAKWYQERHEREGINI